MRSSVRSVGSNSSASSRLYSSNPSDVAAAQQRLVGDSATQRVRAEGRSLPPPAVLAPGTSCVAAALPRAGSSSTSSSCAQQGWDQGLGGYQFRGTSCVAVALPRAGHSSTSSSCEWTALCNVVGALLPEFGRLKGTS